MRPLRVVHIINVLALGGMEYNVLKVVNRLDRARFTATICSLLTPVPAARALVAPDVTVWEFKRRDGLELGLILRLARRLRRARIDVVHTHNWSTFLYGVVAARLAGVKTVVHGEHGLEKDNLVEGPRRRLIRRVLARMVDHFTCVSWDIFERIEHGWGVAPQRITYIPNGVDLSRFGQPAPVAETRALLGIDEADPVVTSIGALRPVKDFGTLLRAFVIVQRQQPKAHLLLIGPDPHHWAMLQERGDLPQIGAANERVHCLGLRLDTPELLSLTDVYVNSSLYEGMSNTILEAMATRRPVVATAVPW